MTENFDYLYTIVVKNTFLYGKFFEAKLKNNFIVKNYDKNYRENLQTWQMTILAKVRVMFVQNLSWRQ